LNRLRIIHKEVYEKAKIKINEKLCSCKQSQKTNEIEVGKPIPGLKNIIAVALGKERRTVNLQLTEFRRYLAKMGFFRE